jgi:hypothetical protein
MKIDIKSSIYILANIGMILAIMFCSCNTSPHTSYVDTTAKSIVSPKLYEEVSIISLLATPDKYNGRAVRIIGYLNMEYENDAIYFHEEDYLHKISKNCIGVEIHKQDRQLSHYQSCNKKYVFVEGIFDMNRKNTGSFDCSIINIKRLEVVK